MSPVQITEDRQADLNEGFASYEGTRTRVGVYFIAVALGSC